MNYSFNVALMSIFLNYHNSNIFGLFEVNGNNWDKLWQTVSICKDLQYLCYLVLTYNDFWQIEPILGSLRQLIIIWVITTYDEFYHFFYYLFQLVMIFEEFCWFLVMTCDNFWQLVTTCDNLWWLETAFDNLWQILTTFDDLW